MREQITQLVDRLASKELTFGCHIQEISPPDKKIQNREWIVLQQSADPSSKDLNCIETYFYGDIEIIKEYNILGHPIYLHDVFSKAEDFKNFDQPEPLGNADNAVNVFRLFQLWKACGIQKSLQSIAEMDTKESKELFQFLLQLGL